jgi:hypothetical protein
MERGKKWSIYVNAETQKIPIEKIVKSVVADIYVFTVAGLVFVNVMI